VRGNYHLKKDSTLTLYRVEGGDELGPAGVASLKSDAPCRHSLTGKKKTFKIDRGKFVGREVVFAHAWNSAKQGIGEDSRNKGDEDFQISCLSEDGPMGKKRHCEAKREKRGTSEIEKSQKISEKGEKERMTEEKGKREKADLQAPVLLRRPTETQRKEL